MIELPLKHPELFRVSNRPAQRRASSRPTGDGKTATPSPRTNAHFKSINGPEIISKYHGESEKQLRVFDEADNAPAIVFIDERFHMPHEDVWEVERRVVAQMLTLMDGMQGRDNVVVIELPTDGMRLTLPCDDRRFDREIGSVCPTEKVAAKSWMFTPVRCPLLRTSTSVGARQHLRFCRR